MPRGNRGFDPKLSDLKGLADNATAIEGAAQVGLSSLPHHIAAEQQKQAHVNLQAHIQGIHPFQYAAQLELEAEKRKKEEDMQIMLSNFKKDDVEEIGVDFMKEGITRALNHSVNARDINFVKIATELAKVIKEYSVMRDHGKYIHDLTTILNTRERGLDIKGGKKRYKKSKKYRKKSEKKSKKYRKKKSRNKRR